MLASGSCLLADVADQFHGSSKKINIVDRLSRHLDKELPALAVASYLQQVKKMVLAEPVIHIDDSDVVKSGGYKFEVLGIVRDGSESTAAKMFIKRATMLQKPVSLQSAIILSAFSPTSILHRKKTISLQIQLPFMP